MSTAHPLLPEADAPAPFQRAISALYGFGRTLLGKIQAAITNKDTTYLPRRFVRAPIPAEQRVARTLDWIRALARTLAGDPHWLVTPTYLFPSWPYRSPPFTAKLREECGLPALPPRTQAQKDAAHLWYVRKVFATQPTGKIVARLARRLGIAQASDFWPSELLAITQTPAAYAAAARLRARQTRPAPAPTPSEPAPATPPPIEAPIKATGPP